MKVIYRGFEIEAKREMSMGAGMHLYYSVMRIADGWFLDDGYTDGSDRVQTFVKYLKENVDEYLANPEKWGRQ